VITGTLEYLRRPFAANLEPGQNVLVLTDTRHDPRVWQAVMTIVSELGAEPTLALFEPRVADYYDPPAAVCAAMQGSDVNVLLASTGMLHSPASMAAMARGIPSICLDGGLMLEDFQQGGVTADYAEIARLKHYVAKNVFGSGARQARVTSRFGTDLTYSVEGRIFVPPLREPGWDPLRAYRRTEEGRKDSPLFACLFPTGEFNVPPVEGSAEGRVVIDLTMHNLGRLQSPIELTVRAGRIVAIQGGADAWTLRRHLERYGDDNARMFPTEASIGINREARIVGVQREDKNIYGALHFGLGTNIDVGGSVRSNIHMDGVILAPTVEVDGERRIEDGRFLVPLDA
jgi:2,5-dihydroxypyridine 5,6-dioxygenase